MRRWFAWGSPVLLLVGACVATPPARTAPTPEPVASTTTVAANGRTLSIVGCDEAPPEAEVLCEAWDLIHTQYVDPVSDDALAQGAAAALDLLDGASEQGPIVCVAPSQEFVASCSLVPEEAESTEEAVGAMLFGMTTLALDPNSAYLDAELLALIESEQEGEVEGIGALVNAEDVSSGEATRCGVISETCRLIIVSVIAGSPAEAAGVAIGDIVVQVDGVDITGWTLDEVTTAVRGQAGTDVAITFERDSQPIELTITRAAVEIPVVTAEIVGEAGYIRLNSFTDTAGDQLQTAIFDFLTADVETIVLDLRDNPGGLLTTAIEVASQFLPDGNVVETISPTSSRIYEVEGNPIVPADMEVIVVVNGGSASASELLSALLQERHRATVVGDNTFGKNTVQQQFDLSNGGALKLTIARWVTPDGLDFGDVGVTPDVVADFPPELTAAAVVELARSLA